MSAPTAADRAQVIAGLRELADLLEAHPELPVTKYGKFRVDAGPVDMGIDDEDEGAKRAAVDAAAAVLGTPVTSHNGHHDTDWYSAGEESYHSWRVQYSVGAITRAAMDAHHARNSYAANIATAVSR